MEDQIGASLFIPRTGGVALTLAGQRFLARARWALRQLDQGAREVGAIGRSQTGHLPVGLFSSIASGFVSRLFAAYDNKHPNVEVEFCEDSATHHLLSCVSRFASRDLDQGVHSADVILNILARRREPADHVTIITPDAMRLRHAPSADCSRYDLLRRSP